MLKEGDRPFCGGEALGSAEKEKPKGDGKRVSARWSCCILV
ncbi:hypothetical protein HM1_1774 [Heliomicrobium modesticaldum Ice1]|uniref:Uncharacterized protein n=1 Tax=Heliobacterium modesticaldum (strain ATCC 51547 / Ice1) TaxID=498761 RepID=B0TET7_HELMI|nr:hypothetical protein HM1_1774 [Heliomicrobium modesticaldum Ice1]